MDGEGWARVSPRPYELATQLVEKKVLRHLGGQLFEPCPSTTDDVPADWIWLPNAIVDGVGGEIAPVELIRQAQNVSALRLFVDLYHAQGLARDGGVHWRQLRSTYSRHKTGEQGSYVVWGFQAKQSQAWATAPFVTPFLTGKNEVSPEGRRDTGWPLFWKALGSLTDVGLLDFVGHVVDADSDMGAVLHPYAIGNGEDRERAIAIAAQEAAEALLTPGQAQWAAEYDLVLLPAQRHVAEIQLVGLPRLKYRARTKATAAWLSNSHEWDAWALRYRQLREQVVSGQPLRHLQHQGVIKG